MDFSGSRISECTGLVARLSQMTLHPFIRRWREILKLLCAKNLLRFQNFWPRREKPVTSRQPRIVLILALFLCPIAIEAMDDVTLKLSPSKAARGQQVTITIRTRLPWDNDVQISHPALNGAITWWAYPYARPWGMKNEDGTVERKVEVRAAVRVDGPGFHSIDPFHIKVKGLKASTDIARIIGVEQDERGFPYPVSVQWRSPPKAVWQGQTIPLILEARNLPYLTLASSASLTQVPAGLLEESPGYGRVITRPYETDTLYDVPMASWLWTLGEPGQFKFPGARVVVSGLTRVAQGFSLVVKPLPAPVRQTGAVGRFRLDVDWERRPYKVNDILSLHVKIEGEGNLGVLRGPLPEIAGAEQVNSNSLSSYLPDSLGYKGWREERFDYRINETGALKIRIPKWPWFDPQDTGHVYSIAEQTYTIQVEEALDEEVLSPADMLLGADLFHYRSLVFHGKNPLLYLLVLPGILLLMTLYVLRRFRLRHLSVVLVLPLLLSSINTEISDAEMAANAKKSAQAGDWREADAIYADLSKRYGELPGLMHDRAITAMENDSPDIAITLIRRSLFLRPGNKLFSQTHKYIENRLGLIDKKGVSLSWSPAWVFGLWLIGANGIFLVLAGFFYWRDTRRYIGLVVMIMVFVVFSAALVATHILWNNKIAIVSTRSQVLRIIPGPIASDWIQLPPGVAVEVMAVSHGDCLVRTGYGLEGWLPLESLYFVVEVSDGL